jgi:hypothetical protein
MVSAKSIATFKSVLTSVLVVSIVGQQVAFAGGNARVPTVSLADVHAALPTAKSQKQAMAVVQLAESRAFGSYFENGGSPAEMKRLDTDIKNLAIANTQLGIADDLKVFLPWWDANKTSILLSRGKFASANLQGVFTEIFIAFKVDETKAKKDPNQFMGWISSQVTNPTILAVSATSFLLTANVALFIGNIVKGSLIAGPAAGVVGAFVEQLVRPIRENAGRTGSRLLRKPGVWLSEKLNRQTNSAQATEEDLKSLAEGIRRTQKLVATIGGYELTPEAVLANRALFTSAWIDTNQAWVEANTPQLRDGRDVLVNAIALRPQSYSTPVLQALNSAEQARQGIEQNTDRIVTYGHQSPEVVEAAVEALLKPIEITADGSGVKSLDGNEAYAHAKASLKTLGATDKIIERLISLRASELVNIRHTAATLATNMLHELQYPEYNTALPEEVHLIQRTLRSGTCLNYYHHEFKVEVTKILNAMNVQLEIANQIVDEAGADTKLRLAKSGKGKGAGAAKRKNADLIGRATDALSRMNSKRQNRVAIERTGDLRGEKGDSVEARAEEAVKRVGKK